MLVVSAASLRDGFPRAYQVALSIPSPPRQIQVKETLSSVASPCYVYMYSRVCYHAYVKLSRGLSVEQYYPAPISYGIANFWARRRFAFAPKLWRSVATHLLTSEVRKVAGAAEHHQRLYRALLVSTYRWAHRPLGDIQGTQNKKWYVHRFAFTIH